MDLLILFMIAVMFSTIIFIIGRYACPKHDRVPLIEVDHVLLWTNLRRGWHVLGTFGPLNYYPDDSTGTSPA